jgi:TatA/E family protein of Tat protein translocase
VDILGIGPLELVLILVVALLVFGPDKLPEIGAKMGKGVRELRQLSREISQGVNTITEPIDELRKPFDDASQVVKQVSDTADALRNPGRALQTAITRQVTTSGEPSAQTENTIAPPSQEAATGPGPEPQVAPDAVAGSLEPPAPLAQPEDPAPSSATKGPLLPESSSQASEN